MLEGSQIGGDSIFAHGRLTYSVKDLTLARTEWSKYNSLLRTGVQVDFIFIIPDVCMSNFTALLCNAMMTQYYLCQYLLSINKIF